MAAATFASKLKDDGSLFVPSETVKELGLHPGDEVHVQVEAANGAGRIEQPDQAALQAKFERFFNNLDTLTFEKPTTFPDGDQTEAAFTEAMDRKYCKLGFKP